MYGNLIIAVVLPEEDPQPYRNALMSSREEGLKPLLDESGDDAEGRDQMNSENPDRDSNFVMSNVADSLDHSDEQKDWTFNPYFQQPKKSKTVLGN